MGAKNESVRHVGMVSGQFESKYRSMYSLTKSRSILYEQKVNCGNLFNTWLMISLTKSYVRMTCSFENMPNERSHGRVDEKIFQSSPALLYQR